MIDDEHLRDLFRQESAEYLQRLDDGLLQLECNPGEEATVEALFRDAHSLKGAAHMLELESVELLAHSLEDMLNNARRDPQARDRECVQEMLRQLRDIREAVSETLLVIPDEPGAASSSGKAPAAATGAGVAEMAGLDGVRVDATRLDALLSAAGELNVARTRVARRLEEIESIVESCEESRRELIRTFGPAHEGASALLERLQPLEMMFERLREGLGEDCSLLDRVSAELNDGVRTMRLLPLAHIFRQFPRMVRDLALSLGKEVSLVIEGEDVVADRRILEALRDPLMHLLRNAVDHGIEPVAERRRAGKPANGRISVSARHAGNALEIVIADDGNGLDEAAICRAALDSDLESAAAIAAMNTAQVHRLIFRAGLTTASRLTCVSGRGVGLDIVHAAIERIKGRLTLDSAPGRGLSIMLCVPVTLVTVRLLIVELDGSPYGLPVEYVLGSRRIFADDVIALDGREAILFADQPIPLAPLGALLERPGRLRPAGDGRQVVILNTMQGTFGVEVDALLDEQEVVLKSPGALLEAVRNVAGATVLDSGAVCVVLSPAELLASIGCRAVVGGEGAGIPAAGRRKRVLLAEDSITTRTQESRILAAAGFEVMTAVDGLDALRKLAREEFDALVTDINMPNLDGIGLVRRVRSEARYAELPIILVTSLAADEDRMRGLEAGANAYITKPGFDQRELIECLGRLI